MLNKKLLIFILLYSSTFYSQFLNEKILVDNNGFIYVIAQKNCPSDTDIVIIKYNAVSGTEVWDYQSEISGSNFLSSAIISGNYIYVTGINHTGANKKALILKCDFNGNINSNYYFQPGGNYSNTIACDNSNNIYIAGRSDLPLNYPKFLIAKYNANLDSIWSYRYTGVYSGNFDEALSIKVDNSGNVYTTGYSSAGQNLFDSYDYLTLKLSPAGTLIWDRKHDGASHKQDIARIINVDSNSNSYVTGYSYNLAGNTISTIKYSPNGDSIAFAQYSCPGSALNFPTAGILDVSKNLYVTGLAQCGSGSYFDYLTLKYDSLLSLKWYKTSISSANSIAFGLSYLNSHVYVTGESDSLNGTRRFLTLKYDASNGNELFRWYVNTSDSNYAISIITDNSENTYVAGYSTPDTIITAKYSAWTNHYFNCHPFGIRKISNNIPESYELLQNYPNPFNPSTKIKFEIPNTKFETNMNAEITIYDVQGRIIAVLVDEKLSPGTYEVEWDASKYSSGVYFYTMRTGNFFEAKKMLLIK